MITEGRKDKRKRQLPVRQATRVSARKCSKKNQVDSNETKKDMPDASSVLVDLSQSKSNVKVKPNAAKTKRRKRKSSDLINNNTNDCSNDNGVALLEEAQVSKKKESKSLCKVVETQQFINADVSYTYAPMGNLWLDKSLGTKTQGRDANLRPGYTVSLFVLVCVIVCHLQLIISCSKPSSSLLLVFSIPPILAYSCLVDIGLTMKVTLLMVILTQANVHKVVTRTKMQKYKCLKTGVLAAQNTCSNC